MRVIVTDPAGAILRTCMTPDIDSARLQRGADGAAIYQVPDDAGLIDDAALVVIAGVLTLKPGADASTEYAGLAVTPIAAAS